MNASFFSESKGFAAVKNGHRYAMPETGNARPEMTFLAASIVVHLIAFLVLAGQFSLFTKDDDYEEAIIIEMIDDAVISDIVEAPAPKPEPISKPAPQSEGVKPTPPKPEPVVEEVSEDKTVEPEPTPEPQAPELTKPAPPKPSVPKPEQLEKKPEPEQVAEKPKEQAQEKPKTMDFQSVLKNLAAEDAPSQQTASQDDSPNLRQAPVLTQPPPVSEQVSMTEMQAVIKQLGSCWSILSGAKDAASLYVDVNLVMNPDRTVREASIVDRARYNRDSFFKAAADSALRALNNPRCKQLELPPYKYDQWKTMTVRFDPKNMF